jgi:hypothetical protein
LSQGRVKVKNHRPKARTTVGQTGLCPELLILQGPE